MELQPVYLTLEHLFQGSRWSREQVVQSCKLPWISGKYSARDDHPVGDLRYVTGVPDGVTVRKHAQHSS